MRTNDLFTKRKSWFWTGICTQITQRLRPPHLLAALGLALALMMHAVPSARAATITVDGTTCTLADAITAANTDTATGGCVAGSGADTITLSQDITLTSALPQVTSDITIEGNNFTIMRDAGAPEFRILYVGSSGDLTVNQATITGGRQVSNFSSGGGILNAGTLQLTNSSVTNNQAFTRAGISNYGSAMLDNVTVANNNSQNGIAGIGNTSGTMVITNSTIRNNVDAPSFSGGIYNDGGTLSVVNSTVSGNTGPGVYNTTGFGTPTTGAITLTDSTVTANTTIGFRSQFANIVTLERNLISGNGTGEITISGGSIPNGSSYNVVGYDGSARSSGFTPSGSDIVPAGPLSSILDTTVQNNGGSTETHALVTGSPAIDAAPSGPAADQRGVARPQGPAFDIGAFELEQASNVAPTAVDDSVTTDEDTPVTFDVLANDSDVDGNLDPTTVSVVSGPSNGTLADNGNGSFTYTPTPDYFGSDSFTYQVCDSEGACATATVTITVNSVNDVPTAVDDSYTTNENAPISISPLDNDSAGPANEDQTLTFIETTSPQNGIVLSFPGGMQYVPNPGFSGSDSFTYTACDSDGACTTATVYITVNAVNVAPIANAGADQTVFRNDVVNVSGTWTDPQGAGDNPYTWSWDLDGDTIPDDSGSANYGDTIVRPTSFAVDGVATLTFSVTDKNGATSSDTVDITVVNRAPTANGQTLSVDEDGSLAITLSGGDADNDPLTYSVLTLPTNGALSGTAPNLTYTPNPDYFGPDSFTFQVNDGLADSNIATVAITVNSVNDPAVAVNDSATTNEDTAVNIPVQGNDSAGPANENQTLTTTAVTDPPNGSAVINPDGSITYTPDANFNGSDSFDYTVCDTDGSCATATVTVLVEMVNDPPVAVDDNVTTPEDTPATFDVLANDSDVDGNLNPGSVTVVSAPVNGALVSNGNGSFTYTPDANFNGSDSFTYQVCDSDGVCASASVTLTVSAVNDAPVCTDVTPSVTVLWPPNHQFEPVTVSGVTDIEGDAITISVSSIFQDEPTNGTGDGDTSPDGQGLGSGTAQVRAERKGNGNGRFYHITVSASDGNGGSCSATVQVSVPKNQGKKGAAVDDGALYDSTQP